MPRHIQRLDADDAGEPGQRLAQYRVIARRMAPDAYVGLLQHLLGERSLIQYTHYHWKQAHRCRLVQTPKRGVAAQGGTREQIGKQSLFGHRVRTFPGMLVQFSLFFESCPFRWHLVHR
jgi:hypothetical protein